MEKGYLRFEIFDKRHNEIKMIILNN